MDLTKYTPRFISTGQEYARGAGDSAHPELWKGHLGSVVPSLFPSGNSVITIGASNAERVGLISEAMGPAGRYFSNIGYTGISFRWPHSSSAASKFKIKPPFSFHMIVRIPSGETADKRVMLYASDARTAAGNYAGLMLYFTHDGQYLRLATANNTSQTFESGWTFIDSVNGPPMDTWGQLIITCSTTFQGGDVDTRNGVWWWWNSPRGSSNIGFQTTAGTSLVNAAVQLPYVGYQRPDATITPYTSYNLALWQAWNRELSRGYVQDTIGNAGGEVRTLMDDPYAMFRPRRRIVGLAISGGRIVSLGGYYKASNRVVLVG